MHLATLFGRLHGREFSVLRYESEGGGEAELDLLLRRPGFVLVFCWNFAGVGAFTHFPSGRTDPSSFARLYGPGSSATRP